MDDPPLLGIPDAAHWSGVPASTIRRWLGEGRLVRYGKHKPWRVDLREVERLRDTLKVPPRVHREH